MTIFCTGKNTPFFTSLILQWAEHQNPLLTGCSLAIELYNMRVSQLFYAKSEMLNQQLVFSLSNACQRCDSHEKMHQLIQDNSLVTGVEVFAVLLRVINVSLMPEWASRLMHVFIHNLLKLRL